MISQRVLKIRTRRKTNPSLVETLRLMRKHEKWKDFAKILSGPTRKYTSLNLSTLNEHSKVGDTLVVPGKILSSGELTKKIRICSLSISAGAKEKMKESKSEWVALIEEVKKNPKAEGVKIVR